jgi:hypothetical protein
MPIIQKQRRFWDGYWSMPMDKIPESRRMDIHMQME